MCQPLSLRWSVIRTETFRTWGTSVDLKDLISQFFIVKNKEYLSYHYLKRLRAVGA